MGWSIRNGRLAHEEEERQKLSALQMQTDSAEAKNNEEKKDGGDKFKGGNFPACPRELSGILTHPFIDPKYIGSIGPLGWVGPPGHTGPSDHNSFYIPGDEPIPGYAPADGWITGISEEWIDANRTGVYEFIAYKLDLTLCDPVMIAFYAYGSVSPEIAKAIAAIPESDKKCQEGIEKRGKTNVHKSCSYKTRIAVKGGDVIGEIKQEPARGGMFFEDWAYDYRQVNPAVTDPELKFYRNEDLIHAFCLFDMYSGELKDQYYKLMGRSDDHDRQLTPRVGEPICGTHYQELVGSVQGTWYANDQDMLSVIHGDIDHTMGMISVGGIIADPQIWLFVPVHSGTINREPSEVTADGKIYCYDLTIYGRGDAAGKALLQLLDENHIQAEHQEGACTGNEAFRQKFIFDR